ncbi:hypothetical protein N7G274_009539 [Stereocaulon virgatum]|uniref:Dephospho-CoA kinase n=1 Tax=Stereocaulon virgatum TaxID=373712 RepID=A0ABR3ZW30_9LECA
MILIGLTGSLATGKSTVSRLLSAPPYSLPIIDADVLARRVVEPGTYGYRQIISKFLPTTPDLLLLHDDDSETSKLWRDRGLGQPINRAALGRRVFGEQPERRRDRAVLNGIIHPLVRFEMAKAVLWYHFLGHWAVVLDIPLLYESGLDVFCGVVVMVAVSDVEVQMRRLRDRDRGLSEQEARDRVGSQIGVGEKVERTRARGPRRGKVVQNDGGLEELGGEVKRVVSEIRGEGGGLLWEVWLWGSPVGAAGVAAWEVWRSWKVRRRWEQERVREKAKL